MQSSNSLINEQNGEADYQSPLNHFCYWAENKQGRPLWLIEAQKYTRLANRSGIFPVCQKVTSIGDVHGDFGCMQKELVETTQVLKPVLCKLHNEKYSHLPMMCYEWIGKNTTVVVLGDYTDRRREDTWCRMVEESDGNPTYYFDGEIHNEEKFIIQLMNYTSVLAWKSRTGGKLVKCLGNHEFMNLDPDGPCHYTTPMQLKDMGGDQGRNDAFAWGGWMRQCIQLCRCYALVQIGNVFYMHGGLNPVLFEKFLVKKLVKQGGRLVDRIPIDENNNFVHNVNYFLFYLLAKPKSEWTDDEQNLYRMLFLSNGGITWDRSLAEIDGKIDARESQWNKVLEKIKYNVNLETKIVLGHCVQFERTKSDRPAFTLMQMDNSNPKAYRLYGVGHKKHHHDEQKDLDYGINFDFPLAVSCTNTTKTCENYKRLLKTEKVAMKRCLDRRKRLPPQEPLPELLSKSAYSNFKKIAQRKPQLFDGDIAYDGRVYRIDCGMSRAFDIDYFVKDSMMPAPNPQLPQLIKNLFARLPQALCLEWDAKTHTWKPSVLIAKQPLPRHWLKYILGDETHSGEHAKHIYSVIEKHFIVDPPKESIK